MYNLKKKTVNRQPFLQFQAIITIRGKINYIAVQAARRQRQQQSNIITSLIIKNLYYY